MRVLGLDISTKAGYALLQQSGVDLRLEKYGTLKLEKGILEYGPYPFCYLQAAEDMVWQLVTVIREHNPDVVVIEETNLGRNRYAQKILEFIHACLLHANFRAKGPDGEQQLRIVYLSSSSWRQALGLTMSKEDKKANAKLSKAKRQAADSGQKLDKGALGIRGKVTKKHIAIRYVNSEFNLNLKVKDNDAADAICLAAAFLTGAEPCDGT